MVPLLDVAAGTGVYGRFDVSLHGAGEDQILLAFFRGGVNDGDGRDRERLGFFREGAVLRAALNKSERADNDERHDDEEEKRKDAVAPRPASGFHLSFHWNSPSFKTTNYARDPIPRPRAA